MILGLAPPSRVREGVVTESSIELLWDPAKGQAHRYEVVCLNCVHSFKVDSNKKQDKLRFFFLTCFESRSVEVHV